MGNHRSNSEHPPQEPTEESGYETLDLPGAPESAGATGAPAPESPGALDPPAAEAPGPGGGARSGPGPGSDHQPPRRFRTALPGLAAIVVMVLSIFFPRLLFSPLLVPIQHEFGMTTAAAGRIFTTIAGGYAPAMVLSGFIATRLTHRLIVSTASTTVGVGLAVTALAPSAAVMYLGALVVGVGAGIYAPSGLSIVSHITPTHRRGLGFAIHELGPATSFVLAPAVAAAFLPIAGWRAIMGGTALFCVAAGVAYYLLGRAGLSHGEAPVWGNLKAIFGHPRFWLMIVFLILAASAAIGVFSVLPTFLIEHRRMDPQLANGLVSASRVSGILMIFLSGALTDRFGFHAMVAAIFAITGTFTIMLTVAEGAVLALSVLLQPAVISAFFPAAIAAITAIGPPRTRNVVISLIIPLANLVGQGLFPAIAGYLADIGLFDRVFQVTGAAMIVAIALTPVFAASRR